MPRPTPRRTLEPAADADVDPATPRSARERPLPKSRRGEPREALYVRVRTELNQRLDLYCFERGISRQDAVERAVERYLEEEMP